MPVFILVRQILRINADDIVAVLASVGENSFVAFDTVGMVILEDVALTSQGVITLPAAEVAGMPILGHGLGVFPAFKTFNSFCNRPLHISRRFKGFSSGDDPLGGLFATLLGRLDHFSHFELFFYFKIFRD